MQIPKLKVLIEAGAVREVEVLHEATGDGWTVQITYASRRGERCEVLERQRAGVRHPGRCGAVSGRAAHLVNPGGLGQCLLGILPLFTGRGQREVSDSRRLDL